MDFPKYTIFVLALLFSGNSYGQNLSSHQWKDRLIMVITTDISLSSYHDQLKIFQSDTEGMNERKLVLYKIAPDQYQVRTDNHTWKSGSSLYEQLKKTDSDLEILLIGLDGTIKLRQTEIITTDKLFAIIDAMPMRQAEMKQKP